MLSEINPGVAAGDWAPSSAPPCPGLSLRGLQCRDEGPHLFFLSSEMQLVRTILICWRNRVEGRWTGEKATEKKHKLLLPQGDMNPTSRRVCSSCPVPVTPAQGASCQGQLYHRDRVMSANVLLQEIPKYERHTSKS